MFIKNKRSWLITGRTLQPRRLAGYEYCRQRDSVYASARSLRTMTFCQIPSASYQQRVNVVMDFGSVSAMSAVVQTVIDLRSQLGLFVVVVVVCFAFHDLKLPRGGPTQAIEIKTKTGF